jgi:hypothetical protein
VNIELLYFDDCPSWQTALEHLQAALDRLGIAASVRLERIGSEGEAVAARFTGSPTIRVDSEDLFPPTHSDYALGCRVYATPEGLRGWPTIEMIQTALASRQPS